MFYKLAIIFLLVLMFIGCAEMQKPMMDAMKDAPTVKALTTDNVLRLQVGKTYRMSPHLLRVWT